MEANGKSEDKTVAEKPTEANNGEAEAKKDKEKNGENFLLFFTHYL